MFAYSSSIYFYIIMKISNKSLIFNLHLDGPEIDHLSPLHFSSHLGMHTHTPEFPSVAPTDTNKKHKLLPDENTPTVLLTSKKYLFSPLTDTRTQVNTHGQRRAQMWGCFMGLRPWRYSSIFNLNPNCGLFFRLVVVYPHRGRSIEDDTLNHSVSMRVPPGVTIPECAT